MPSCLNTTIKGWYQSVPTATNDCRSRSNADKSPTLRAGAGARTGPVQRCTGPVRLSRSTLSRPDHTHTHTSTADTAPLPPDNIRHELNAASVSAAASEDDEINAGFVCETWTILLSTSVDWFIRHADETRMLKHAPYCRYVLTLVESNQRNTEKIENRFNLVDRNEKKKTNRNNKKYKHVVNLSKI